MAINQLLTDTSLKYAYTSVERLLFYIDEKNELGKTTNEKRKLNNWLYSTSRAIDKYLDRKIWIEEYTEYFDTMYNVEKYFVTAAPVWSISSCEYDSTGEFDGGEATIDSEQYHLSKFQDAVIFDYSFDTEPRSLKIVYTGGLAYHPVHSVFTTGDTTGFTKDNYCIGETSGAVGLVVEGTSNSLTLHVLDSVFENGETITEYNNIEESDATGQTAVISAIQKRALVESYTDISRACEMQIRYYYDHIHDFENNGINRDGENVRRAGGATYELEAEVRQLLDPYRRVRLFAHG